MPETAPQPTLLIFTLGPRRESGRRRLLPERWRPVEHDLHRRSLEAAIAAGRACGCRIEVAAPYPLDLDGDVRQTTQRGRSFGERLREAIRGARSRSAGPLVVVGTDSPDLDAEHVAAAIARLRRDPERVVVGPAHDGGFYLLAATGPLDEELTEVRWCCAETRGSLLRALGRRGRRLALLTPLHDLDRRADLLSWLARRTGGGTSWRALAGRLLELFAALRRPLPAPAPARRLPVPVRIVSSRGPPR